MSEKTWPVQSVTSQPFTASAPERFTNAEMIEIRVQITPLRWIDGLDGERRKKAGVAVYAEAQVVEIEARDHQAIFHISEQLLFNLFREYMGIKR
jgi:hypothetical protein